MVKWLVWLWPGLAWAGEGEKASWIDTSNPAIQAAMITAGVALIVGILAAIFNSGFRIKLKNIFKNIVFKIIHIEINKGP